MPPTAGLYESAVPSEQDAKLATESSRILAARSTKDALRVHLEDGQTLTLPYAATRLLSYLLTEMAEGNAVTLIPIHAEMTTQEAADYLNVSRPYLIGLLESGTIHHRKVGTHRRIKFSDVKRYKDEIDQKRHQTLDELAQQAQELNMGY